MFGLFWIALVALLLYLAWRAIRGGFERPQSSQLNAFGVAGIALACLVALSLVAHLF